MPIAPKAVQEAARRALEARERVPPSRKAGTPVGIARANQLANGENLSANTLLRMWSYLSRAEYDYKIAQDRGLDLESSKAIQAYYLWGGPAALAWVRRELNK
jgi:hypothetical protein